MIPLSSRIDKYKRIVEKKEKAGKPCDIIHIKYGVKYVYFEYENC